MAKRRQRRMFTAAESAEVWDRWQRGEGINLIGRVMRRWHTAVFNHLKPHGGIRPVPRTRSRGSLMDGRARRSVLKLRLSVLRHVLRRPTETAIGLRHATSLLADTSSRQLIVSGARWRLSESRPPTYRKTAGTGNTLRSGIGARERATHVIVQRADEAGEHQNGMQTAAANKSPLRIRKSPLSDWVDHVNRYGTLMKVGEYP